MKQARAIELIKKGLWMRGYSVKDVSGFMDCDLIVKKKYRITVIENTDDEKLYSGEVKTTDIVAIYLPREKWGKKMVFARMEDFNRLANQCNDSEEKWDKIFTTKTDEIFK
jgi:hypothetical protein